MKIINDTNHTKVAYGRVGILLVNLGTPDAYTYWAMRRYLQEFLLDTRVIDLPRWKWWPILFGPVLTFRPRKAGAAYKKIWDTETNESPLRRITRQQAKKVQAHFGDSVVVDWAMRYGTPSIQERMTALQKQGCEKIVVMPLYPQHAGATTGSVGDAVAKTQMNAKWQPTLRTVPPYYDHPAHIAALTQSVRDTLAQEDTQPQVVIASFHGVPVRYCTAGDPYYCQCHKTARLMAEDLGWTFAKSVKDVLADKSGKPILLLSFQSQFGPEEWVKPATDDSLEALAQSGIENVAVLCPGFAADCVETLEEINIEGRAEFMEAGGKHFTMIPCLNDSETGIDMLVELLENELQGWV